VTSTVAVLGPGGVGGFVAGALARAGGAVTVVAREDTAGGSRATGLRVESVRLGHVHRAPGGGRRAGGSRPTCSSWRSRRPALDAAARRVRADPGLVVPLLNGVEHVARLRERFGDRVVAATIRIAGRASGARAHRAHEPAVPDRPGRGGPRSEAFAHVLRAAEIPTRSGASEPDVLWSKLTRLAALALTTAAAGAPIGAVRGHPRWRVLLEGAVDETAAVARAEGARLDAARVLAELAELRPEQTSSLARDVEAGAEDELDAIGGAVLRAGARHGLGVPVGRAARARRRARYAAR
jgi:2-dehydropantoate 2-reductase